LRIVYEFLMLIMVVRITKREVLQYVAKIYDPLGFIVPITFHGSLNYRVFGNIISPGMSSCQKHFIRSFTSYSSYYKKFQLLKFPVLLEPLIMIQFFKC